MEIPRFHKFECYGFGGNGEDGSHFVYTTKVITNSTDTFMTTQSASPSQSDMGPPDLQSDLVDIHRSIFPTDAKQFSNLPRMSRVSGTSGSELKMGTLRHGSEKTGELFVVLLLDGTTVSCNSEHEFQDSSYVLYMYVSIYFTH
jgi:hypothetical protein